MSNQYIKVMNDETYILFVSKYLKVKLNTICAPEHHDLPLFDLKKTQFQKGRISYIINCKHLENIDCTIQNIKFNIV